MLLPVLHAIAKWGVRLRNNLIEYFRKTAFIIYIQTSM